MSETEKIEATNISEEQIASAAELKIWNEDGKEVRFGDLFETQKVVVVFIRHFFCGLCQAYCAQLAEVEEESLKKAETKIIVVGCGDWKAIKQYHESSGFGGSIYADPSVKLYRNLGMTIRTTKQTPSGQKRRSYVVGFTVMHNIMAAITQAVKSPQTIGRQGDMLQLGGEFIFGPGKACSYAHLMQNTTDHIEVADLMKLAGVSS